MYAASMFGISAKAEDLRTAPTEHQAMVIPPMRTTLCQGDERRVAR